MADYFEAIVNHTSNYKAASNWMTGPVRSWLNENNKEIDAFPLPAQKVAALIQLVETGKLSFSSASSRLLPYLVQHPSAQPEQAAIEQNLIQQSDASSLEPLIDEVLSKYAEKVHEYKKGKDQVSWCTAVPFGMFQRCVCMLITGIIHQDHCRNG